MKKAILVLSFILFGLSSVALAQKGIEPQIQRDPVLEADSLHNLDVANQAYKLRKAYRGVLERLEETLAANPTFSKMDEVLYLLGMSSYYLSEGKGKQTLQPKTDEEKKKFTPENLRANAAAYFSQLAEQFPASKFKADADKTLKLIKDKE